TGGVLDSEETGAGGSSASPSGSNTDARAGADARAGDGASELEAAAALSGGSRAGIGGAGGASTGLGSPDDDGAAGAGGSSPAGSNANGSGGAAASAAGTAGTPNEPPDSTGSTVSTRVGPAPVLLGEAGTFAILAQSAITNVPLSAITVQLGISPAAASSITGFPLLRAGTSLLAPEVVGKVFAADSDPPTPDNLISAISDMQAA